MSPTNNKVAIVTGGVSGIGEELTRTLIKNGWKTVAFDIPSQSHLAAQLHKELGDAFEFTACDVSKYHELAQCFSEAFHKTGRIDAFLSNAGIIDQSSVYIFSHRGKNDIPPEPNTLSTDVCFKALISAGLHPIASFPEYSGVKAAVNAYAQASAPILKLHENITINTVCPGPVPTDKIPQEMRDTLSEDYLTRKTAVAAAYMKFLNDPSLNGEWAEASRDKVLLHDKLPYMDGEYSRRNTQVWDPYFKAVHGEFSGLEDIVKPLN